MQGLCFASQYPTLHQPFSYVHADLIFWELFKGHNNLVVSFYYMFSQEHVFISAI